MKPYSSPSATRYTVEGLPEWIVPAGDLEPAYRIEPAGHEEGRSP